MKKLKMVLIVAISLMGYQVLAQAKTLGFQLYWMEQYQKAKKVLLKEANSGNLTSWFYLGKIYFQEDKIDSAKYCFDAIRSKNAESKLVTIGDAMIQWKTGQKWMGLSMLEKVMNSAKQDKDFFALDEIALARFMTGDTVKWKEPLDAALKIANNSEVYLTYGDIWAKMGDLYIDKGYDSKASSKYRQAVYFDDKNMEAWSKLAELYIRSLNFELGGEVIKKILSLDSTYVPGLKQAGEYYFSIGKYPLACYYYNKYILAIEPTDKDLGRYATFLFFNKDYDKTGEYVNKVLQSEPDNEVMLRLKGYSAYEQGKYAEGLEAMTRFFNLRSGIDGKKTPGDYEYYGRLLIKNNQPDPGIQNLETAIKADPRKIYLYEDIAGVYENAKKYPEAVAVYEKYILQKKTGTSALYFKEGMDLLFYAKNLEVTPDSVKSIKYLWKADSAFAKVCELSPSSYLGFWKRAQTKSLIDKDSKLGLAKPDYEKALALSESDPGKNKDVIVEANWYLGSYYFTKWDESKAAGNASKTEELKAQSLTYWNKLIALDSSNEAAKAAILELNKK